MGKVTPRNKKVQAEKLEIRVRFKGYLLFFLNRVKTNFTDRNISTKGKLYSLEEKMLKFELTLPLSPFKVIIRIIQAAGFLGKKIVVMAKEKNH